MMMTLQEDAMRTIDIHAHLMPQCLWRTVDAGNAWHGIPVRAGGLAWGWSSIKTSASP